MTIDNTISDKKSDKSCLFGMQLILFEELYTATSNATVIFQFVAEEIKNTQYSVHQQ